MVLVLAAEYRWSAQSVGADDEFSQHCVRQRHVQVRRRQAEHSQRSVVRSAAGPEDSHRRRQRLRVSGSC